MTRVLPIVSGVSFLLLFPGFFVYHYAVASGRIPPVLGGWFTYVCLGVGIAFVAFVPPILVEKFPKAPVGFSIFIGLVGWCAAWTGYHLLQSTGPVGYLAEEQIAEMLIGWGALFMVGMFLPVRSRWFAWACVGGIGGMALITASHINPSTFMFDLKRTFNIEEVASYQAMAGVALMTALAILARFQHSPIGFAVMAAPMALLFVLGARTELVGYALLFLAVCLIGFVKSPKNWLNIGLAVSAVAVMAVAGSDRFLNSRQLELLRLSESGSWNSRSYLTEIAVWQITESPVTGLYAGHFDAGGKGEYAHNALSAWVAFGFPGFALYAAMILWASFVCWRRVLLSKDIPPVWWFAFHVNFVALVFALGSKAVFWPMPALGWGAAIGAMALDGSQPVPELEPTAAQREPVREPEPRQRAPYHSQIAS